MNSGVGAHMTMESQPPGHRWGARIPVGGPRTETQEPSGATQEEQAGKAGRWGRVGGIWVGIFSGVGEGGVAWGALESTWLPAQVAEGTVGGPPPRQRREQQGV